MTFLQLRIGVAVEQWYVDAFDVHPLVAEPQKTSRIEQIRQHRKPTEIDCVDGTHVGWLSGKESVIFPVLVIGFRPKWDKFFFILNNFSRS